MDHTVLEPKLDQVCLILPEPNSTGLMMKKATSQLSYIHSESVNFDQYNYISKQNITIVKQNKKNDTKSTSMHIG